MDIYRSRMKLKHNYFVSYLSMYQYFLEYAFYVKIYFLVSSVLFGLVKKCSENFVVSISTS